MKFYQRIGPIDKIRLCLLLLCALTAFPVHALDVGHRSAPVLVDIDNDGDKDIFIGESDGSINLFTNAGTAAKPAFLAQVGESDPLDGIDVGDDSDPVFVDIDNDGDQDVFIGESGGGVEYYENVGTPGDAAFEERAGALNPLDGVDVGTNNAISFADIDADGDFDAFIGESTGFILYFENIGTAASAGFQEKSSVDNPPFDRIDVGSYGVPAFVDIDNDGDLDAFVGENSGIIAYFENTGTAGSPRFVPAPNPLAWVDTGSKSNPDFVDIDKDGDFDLFIGKSDGSLHFYENNGSAEAPNFVERIASALFPSVADFGLNPGDIPALDAAQISALVPQALGSFEAENVAVLSAAAVSALNAEQLANVRADALAGLTPAQFQSLSTAALSGLNAQNAGGLAADVIINFTPEAIAALDLNKVHLAAGKDIGRMLTNLGCDLISPEQAAALAPAGWKIDLSNGAITAPAGSGLGLKAVAQPADLPPEVELSELPDLDTVFGVGACWQGATQLEKLNLALADKGPGAFTFSQQQDKGGILLLTGPGLEMSFIPDASRMTQAGADAVSGVLVDENSGRITITTQDKRQFSLIPAPAEPAKLANVMGSGSRVAMGEGGAVLLVRQGLLPRQAAFVHLAVIFDPFIEPAPAGICMDIGFGSVQCDWSTTPPYRQPGVHVFNPFFRKGFRAAPEEISRVVYEDGTSQKVYASVLSPAVFEAKMREIEGVEGLVYNVNDGTFDLMYQGRAHHLSPNFDSKATDLVEGARVASQITINKHGDSLEYLHQSGTQAITTTVHISPRMHGIIHEPGIFASTVSAFPGIDAVTPNTDGSFDVSMPGQTFVITATFHVLTAEFNPQTDTPVIPAVSINSEGSITYEVQTDIRVVNTRLLVEAKLPEVPSPTLLIAKLSEAGAVRIVLNSDGSFSGMISGQGFTLTPTSDVQTQTLTAGEQIPPSIASNEDGSLSYTAQQGNQVVTVKLLVMFD